eukprot:395658_1
MSDSESTYIQEDEYEDESEEIVLEEDEYEEIVLEEELPHPEDEYSESDSYEYPWPTSSDDSWADLSEDEVINKIVQIFPNIDLKQLPKSPTIIAPLQPASDCDTDSCKEYSDEQNDYVYTYEPNIYLKSIETYKLYVVSHSDEATDHEEKTVNHNQQSNDILIKPLQSEMATISDDTFSARVQDNEAEYKFHGLQLPQPNTRLSQYSDSEPEDKNNDFQVYRMTKERIVIKKVAAKRAPKRFKMDMKVCIKDNKEYEG